MPKQKKPKQKIPENGDTISLLHESGEWHQFTVRWFSDDMCILESFNEMFPMDKKSLMELLSDD